MHIASNIQYLHRRLVDIGVVVHRHYPLSRLSHIRCGGVAQLVAMPSSSYQLWQTMLYIMDSRVPYYIVGQCSKLLIDSDNIHGIVVCTRGVSGISIDIQQCTAYALCGTHTVVCANALAGRGLSGAEYMYCLPATIGGAVYMNAGCYGSSTADIVDSVHCMDTVSGRLLTLDSSQCRWSMRHSVFMDTSLLILGANLLLTNGNKQCIIDSMKANMASKASRQPLHMPSLGSSHYTTSGTPASALIDRAGLKGYTVGGAQISTKHAGFVVNIGGATSSDIDRLLQYTAGCVADTFGTALHQEIIHMTMRD